MPTPIPPGMRLGVVEPREATEAFQRRGLLQPSFRWQDVWQEEHGRALAVAGVSRLDVLKVFQDELALGVKEGRSLEDFRARIRPQLAAKGFWGDVEVMDRETGELRTTRFDDRRLQLIFETNMRQSQAAGRWERIQRTKKRFPFILYRTMRDERVRASHRPWDSLALPVDDPFWNMHYPPNGWRCRCTAFAVDQRELDRRRAGGEEIRTEAPEVRWMEYVNPSTGEVVPVPHGVDPGFAYNPGKAREAKFFEEAIRKAAKAPPSAGARAVREAVAAHPELQSQAVEQLGAWVGEVLQSGKARGRAVPVGVLRPEVVQALQDRGVSPASAAIALRDEDLLHALRDAKPGGVRAEAALFGQLPELLAEPGAVLIERAFLDGAKTGEPALLYVIDLLQPGGEVAKVVVRLDYRFKARLEEPGEKARRVSLQMNTVRTVTVMDPQALSDERTYQVLWGSLG